MINLCKWFHFYQSNHYLFYVFFQIKTKVVTSWRQGTELSLFCWWNLKKKNQTLSEDKMRIFWKQEKCLHSHLRSDKSSRKFRDIIVKTWWHPLKRTTLTEKSLRKICASINHLNATPRSFWENIFPEVVFWSALLSATRLTFVFLLHMLGIMRLLITVREK